VAELKTGGVQIVSSPPAAQINELQGGDTEVLALSGARLIMHSFNTTKPPFDDVRVRQALNYAIDRDSIVEFVMGGVATPSTCSIMGPGVPGAAEGFCYEYDPERARALLAEAGVPEGFQFDLWGPSGRYTRDKEIVEAVAGQLEAVGLSPQVQVFGDFPTYIQEAVLDTELDLAFCSIIGTPYDASGYFIYFQSDLAGKPFNISRVRDEEVDRLTAEGAAETDPEARQAIYTELQQKITEDAYFIVLQHEQTLTAVRSNVEGIQVRPSYELIVDYASKSE
jgi:peptide/nickel transport system substrate-binding protein